MAKCRRGANGNWGIFDGLKTPEDRPRAKLECLRMPATLKLDPARTELIGVFMNSYLKLTATEMNVYNRELQAIAPEQKVFVMQVVNEWTEMAGARLVTRILTDAETWIASITNN